MRTLRAWFLRFGDLFRKHRHDAELADELESHLQFHIEDNVRAGMSLPEARRQALLKLGGVEQTKEKYRDLRGLPSLESFGQDVRFAARLLRKSPGFTAVAVLTLCLGIGANTAIFQLLDAVRLRTLPVKDPQQLAVIQLPDMSNARGSQLSAYPSLTNPIWEALRDREKSFSGTFAWTSADFNLNSAGEARLSRGLWVSGDYFRVLGVQPALGRVLSQADDQRGCPLRPAVISYSFWQREFGGDPAVLGKQLSLGFHPVEVVGVASAGFLGLEVGRPFDVALPICAQPILYNGADFVNNGSDWWLTVMGRLNPGVSLEQATAELRAISPGIFQSTLPKNYPAVSVKDYLSFQLIAARATRGFSMLRDQYSDPLILLLATTGLVLLIACANLANLMLARTTAREREIAVRIALGASRMRLVRQLLAESLLITAAGSVLGLFLSGVLSDFLVSYLSTSGSTLFFDLRLDWRVLAFTILLASLTTALFGLMPLVRATRVSPQSAMNAGGRGQTASRERFGFRRALVASQVAVSLVLLAGAILLSRSLGNILAVDPGFRESDILIASVDYARLNLPPGPRLAFKQDLAARIRALPGVDSVSDAGIIPFSGSRTDDRVWLDGSDSQHALNSNFNWVGQGYFETLQTKLVAGRDFSSQDTPSTPKVAIVNQAFARQLGLGPGVVGNRIRREATPFEPEAVFEIVGMVANTKYWDLKEEFGPIVYLASAQDSDPDLSARFLIRSRAPLADVTSRVRTAFTQASPEMGFEFTVFQSMIRENLLRERLMATLSGFFGPLAGLITALGLYGVISFLVARRTNEIGIRMALGAQPSDVLRLILKETLLLTLVGIAIGLPLALASGWLISSFLYGLKPTDPLTIAFAVLAMSAVTLLAGYLPARRAMRVDPMVALHYE
jgi:putative ABC transport system permease protein